MGLQPLKQDYSIPDPISSSALDGITNNTKSAIIALVILAVKEPRDILLGLEIIEFL